MRALLISGGIVLALSVSGQAMAWDGPTMWYESAAAAMPGGDGIVGTGAARDYNITCAHCHTQAESLIDLKFDFTPALPEVGGEPTYVPGQAYDIAVTLVGEHLGTANCDQYMTRVNNFAATFEDAAGKAAGVLRTEAGATSDACPQDPPVPGAAATFLYKDCKAIISNGAEDAASWTFSWTAPPAGAGQVTLFYGAVDGNCDMSSKGDDVKVGTIKLGEATASLAPSGKGASSKRGLALLGLLPLGLALAWRRRHRAR